MNRNRTNFWIDVAIFVVFLVLVFTGFLLHLLPSGGGGGSVLNLTGQDWKGLHMLSAMVFIVLVVVHLVLHRSWGGACGKKYVGIGPWVLGIITGILFLAAVCIPFFLAGDNTGEGNGYRGGRGEGYGIESNLSGINRGPGPGGIPNDTRLEPFEASTKTTPGRETGGHRWGKKR